MGGALGEKMKHGTSAGVICRIQNAEHDYSNQYTRLAEAHSSPNPNPNPKITQSARKELMLLWPQVQKSPRHALSADLVYRSRVLHSAYCKLYPPIKHPISFKK